uniref:FAS-associated factor 1 n=1 Tax=Myxine glutinosa TaxID=7769 RepID=UPI00358E441F
MATMDREMILADFQACTGIENIDEAITLLEQNNWDLLAAINGVIPQENGITSAGVNRQSALSPSAGVSSPTHVVESSSAIPVWCPLLERQPRFLNFAIEYKNRSIDAILEDSSSIGDIKSFLQKELQIPVERMELRGWKTGEVSNSTILRTLHLPKHNSLYLHTADLLASTSTSGSDADRLQKDFLLNITNLETHIDYKLPFRGNNSVQDVKSSIADLTNIPVRDQQWEGWPRSVQNDMMTLVSCGLQEPSHNLSVSRKPDVSGSQNRRTEDVQMVSEEESDVDDVHFGMDETESEIFGGEAVTQRKFRPMMPDGVENEVDALMHFMAEFSSRYGEQHPVFFIGSLEDACQEAFYCPAQDRKLLAVYLHHDSSILAHVFCSQLLCAESVVAFLSQSCISWAWDVTTESSRARLLSLCSRHFGSVAAQTLRAYSPEQFPLLLLISGKRNANEVISVTTGNTTLDELMMRLMHAMDIFTEQQQQDIRDEEERAARESMKREQDEAYQLSLEADRAKCEAQEREIAEQARIEQQKIEQEQEKEAIRKSLALSLPDEPPDTQSHVVAKVRIRTPSGNFLERRFLAAQPLSFLLDFIASQGFPLHEYKLLSTYPRRDVSQLDASQSLQDLGLGPQETLFLEAKQ